jgi:hypothetical protein
MSPQFWQVAFAVLVSISIGVLSGWQIAKTDRERALEAQAEVEHLRLIVEQLRRDLITATERELPHRAQERPNPFSLLAEKAKSGESAAEREAVIAEAEREAARLARMHRRRSEEARSFFQEPQPLPWSASHTPYSSYGSSDSGGSPPSDSGGSGGGGCD